MVTSAIQSVLSLLILIGIGFYIAGKAWYPKWGTSFLAKLCVNVAIPCHMFYSTLTTVKSPNELMSLFRGMPVPFFTILFNLGLGLMLARTLRIAPYRRGVFLNAVTFSNSVLLGFAIVETIFGSAALPDAMIYYMANTTLFWTIGTWLLRRDSALVAERTASIEQAEAAGAGVPATMDTESAARALPAAPETARPAFAPAAPAPAAAGSAAAGAAAIRIRIRSRAAAAWDLIRTILSPPLVGFLLALGVTMAAIRLPDAILAPIASLRQMTTPLAMIFTGGIIRGTDFSRARVSRDLGLVMATRFLLTPVLMVLILRPLPVSQQMKQIFFLMATMPVMTQLGIMAKESGSDSEYASLLVTVTTTASLLAVPLYLYLLERFQVF